MNKRIRVLHVAEAAGGVERYLQTLFKYNDKEQVENILVCSQNYDYKKFEELADRVIVLKMAHQINPSSDIKVEKALRKIIKEIKPDIVYAHSSKAGALARIADLGLNNKVIYNPHGWAFNTQPSRINRRIYKLVEILLSHFCNKIICISDAEKKSAIKEKVCKPYKLQIIYNGIDLEEIKDTIPKTRAELQIPEDAFVIGMVARITKLKSPDIFIKAAALIKKDIPNAYFMIVGDGELRIEIEKLIHQYNLDASFLITGWVDNPTAYVKIMNVGMLLSRWWEGFGLVLPEYMACNVPSIATNVGGIPDVIHNNDNGILVNEDDYVDSAQKIYELYKDKKLIEKIVKNGEVSVKCKFNGKKLAENNEKVYKNVLHLYK